MARIVLRRLDFWVLNAPRVYPRPLQPPGRSVLKPWPHEGTLSFWGTGFHGENLCVNHCKSSISNLKLSDSDLKKISWHWFERYCLTLMWKILNGNLNTLDQYSRSDFGDFDSACFVKLAKLHNHLQCDFCASAFPLKPLRSVQNPIKVLC